MSRDTSRDERNEFREQGQMGRMVLSQARSGGSSSSGSDDTEQATGHLNSDAKRNAAEQQREHPANLSAKDRASRSRDVVLVRNRAYHVSPAECALLADVGKFRTISVSDLLRHRYDGDRAKLRQDVVNLKAQKLVRQCRIMRGKGREDFSVLVLTKEGKHLTKQQRDSSQQQFYAGLVKPQEIAHDAALYLMYQAEAAEIERQGGIVRRVVLDYELKKRVYAPLAKVRELPALEYARRQAEIAAENGLKVVEGKIPLPDLRIEYQTVEGELAKVDLELATEHYHGGHAAGKLKAGFKVYPDRHSASRLNAALSYGRSSTYDGPELTAQILSL